MFPKQLYGTTTNSPQLYRQFVSQDPYNKIGARHFEHVLAETKDWLSPWPKRYTWAAHGTTWIRIHRRKIIGNPFPNSDKWFDYISGVMLKDTAANQGWAVLLEMFGIMLQILKGVLSISVAEIVAGVINLGEAIFDEEKMHREADVKGFITSITEAIDARNKRRKDGKKKQVEKPSTANILVLIQRIEAGSYSPRDMGTRPMQMR